MRVGFKFVVLIGLFLVPFMVRAGDFSYSVAPVWWQYKESAVKTPTIPDSPLNSSAQGYDVGLGIDYLYDLNPAWHIKTTWNGLLPLTQGHERWNLATGLQLNQLQVFQSEVRLDVSREIGNVDLSFWSSYFWHNQVRKNFVKNGVKLNISSVSETVQVVWLGLGLDSTSENDLMSLHLEAGVPAWVHTTNSAVKGSFSKRTGFRAEASASFLLPWSLAGADMHIESSYEYRKLGGELLSGVALWPENRWQSISLGVNVKW